MSDPIQSKAPGSTAAASADLALDSRWSKTIGEVNVLFCQGALRELGEMAREIGASHALLVTDRGLIRAGHPSRARTSLDESCIQVSVFDHVEENPSSQQEIQALGKVEAATTAQSDDAVD